MAAMKEHGIAHDRVNVHGGALRARPSDRRVGRTHRRDAARSRCASSGKTRGVAALCIGGGEATALAIELV
jgi:acetyl-CoA C-acetyltransferase